MLGEIEAEVEHQNEDVTDPVVKIEKNQSLVDIEEADRVKNEADQGNDEVDQEIDVREDHTVVIEIADGKA